MRLCLLSWLMALHLDPANLSYPLAHLTQLLSIDCVPVRAMKTTRAGFLGGGLQSGVYGSAFTGWGPQSLREPLLLPTSWALTACNARPLGHCTISVLVPLSPGSACSDRVPQRSQGPLRPRPDPATFLPHGPPKAAICSCPQCRPLLGRPAPLAQAMPGIMGLQVSPSERFRLAWPFTVPGSAPGLSLKRPALGPPPPLIRLSSSSQWCPSCHEITSPRARLRLVHRWGPRVTKSRARSPCQEEQAGIYTAPASGWLASTG